VLCPGVTVGVYGRMVWPSLVELIFVGHRGSDRCWNDL
jgi:hypothetical protein